MDTSNITNLCGRQLVPGWEAQIISHRDIDQASRPADEVEVYDAVRQLLLLLPDDDVVLHVLSGLLTQREGLWYIPLDAQRLARLIQAGGRECRWVCAGCTIWVDTDGQFEQ